MLIPYDYEETSVTESTNMGLYSQFSKTRVSFEWVQIQSLINNKDVQFQTQTETYFRVVKKDGKSLIKISPIHYLIILTVYLVYV